MERGLRFASSQQPLIISFSIYWFQSQFADNSTQNCQLGNRTTGISEIEVAVLLQNNYVEYDWDKDNTTEKIPI